MTEIEEIDLGFAEKCSNSFRLTAISYPSKIGGKPAWLRWDNVPNEKQVKCENCCKILRFLCQIYIPIEIDEKHYHKTIYLFCCLDGHCYSSNKNCLRSFTSILEESENDLTEDELESKSTEELESLLRLKESLQTLCQVCSLYGDKKCSNCHSVYYCSKEHQVYDWKKNSHREMCKNKDERNSHRNKYLFDEYEIVIEEEPPPEGEKLDNIDIDEKKLKELMKDEKPLDKRLEKEFSKATANTVDEYFEKFKKRINREPSQVVRYNLGGIPLWVSSENIPSDEDIKDCSCGSKRQFEFQVLPQMLNYLGINTTVDSIDWGTICVYTCIKNCQLNAYTEAFVWKQDFSKTNI